MAHWVFPVVSMRFIFVYLQWPCSETAHQKSCLRLAPLSSDFLLAHLFFSHFLLLSLSVQEMKICSAIINLFHLIPAAPQTLVKPLLEVVMKTERAMLIEVLHHLCPKSFSRQI